MANWQEKPKNSGYTPFTVNISEYIKEGKNIITVEADNRFSPDMLPVNRSFDWANDGGIIRPVELWVTRKAIYKGTDNYSKTGNP